VVLQVEITVKPHDVCFEQRDSNAASAVSGLHTRSDKRSGSGGLRNFRDCKGGTPDASTESEGGGGGRHRINLLRKRGGG